MRHIRRKALWRQRLLLLLEVGPEVQQGDEVGVLVAEPRVRLVGLGLLVGRPLAGVLHGQGGDDDEHLAGAAERAGLDEHAPEPRVHGQPRQRLPVCREPPPATTVPSGRGLVGVGDRVEGLQLLQQPHAVGDLARVGGVDERERARRRRARARSSGG